MMGGGGYGGQAPGMMNQQYNQNMMQMTPYGLQQQQQAPMNNGGYGQQGGMNGGMMGGGGMAGPGQMLQIQAGPGYQQQNTSSDPFSAFDGL